MMSESHNQILLVCVKLLASYSETELFTVLQLTLHKLEYDIHTKLPLESYQIDMIPVAIWYEYHFAVYYSS